MMSVLPSWRPGPTRDAVMEFLDAAADLPVPSRLACFDNDGTLWCERPRYSQLDFFVHVLKRRVGDDPSLSEKPELAAVLGGDADQIAELGLARVVLALAGLFERQTPEQFAAEVNEFVSAAQSTPGVRPLRERVYTPMLELIDELRRRDFTIAIVTGAGAEFLRVVSPDLYGVPPERVIGTLIDYEMVRDDHIRPRLVRKATVSTPVNEGAVKVVNIQSQLGRRPVLAAGNSSGDREMLEWVAAGEGPSLALLIDHDDAEREFAYQSRGESVANDRPITEIGRELNWAVISMANDWSDVFAPPLTTRSGD